MAEHIQDLNDQQKKAVFDLLKAQLEPAGANDPQGDGVNVYDDRKIPSLVKFSGGKAKGEASYRKWKFEVQELISGNCPEYKIRRAIQKSLFGTAGDSFITLAKETSVADILCKFDKLFQPAEDVEHVFGKFYAAKQDSAESLSDWYVRIETILDTPSLELTSDQKEKMLRARFWKGLHSESLKNGLRHKFDNNSTSVELHDSARIIAEEVGATAQVQVQSTHDQFAVLNASVEKLVEKISKLEAKVNASQSSKQSYKPAAQSTTTTSTSNAPASKSTKFHGRCFKCHRYGHKAADCLSKKSLNDQLSA